jgi:hypothetical protein
MACQSASLVRSRAETGSQVDYPDNRRPIQKER